MDGRINPREVKRFVNSYTLQRMVHQKLDAGAMLALQTLDFRRDWEAVYEVLLAEPDVFIDALHRYRGENGEKPQPRALENLWPSLSVLPADLADYLHSAQAAALLEHKHDLEQYMSSLHSTRSAQPWVKDAFRDVGHLRQLVREVKPDTVWGSDRARQTAEQIRTLLSRAQNYQGMSHDTSARLSAPIGHLLEAVEVLNSTGGEADHTPRPEEVDAWRRAALDAIDQLQDQLRLVRRASAFGTD